MKESTLDIISKVYPSWQQVSLTKVGYTLQRSAAIEILNEALKIKHFEVTHFTARTIGGRVFLYCPVGNICSWSSGDVEHKWCEWCKKGFEELV